MTVTPEGVCPKIVESLEGAPRWTVVRHIKLPFDSCFVVLFKYRRTYVAKLGSDLIIYYNDII